MIRFYEAFIEDDQLHIVTDYASYGDLHRQMKKHASRKTQFSERAVWSFFLQLVMGIKYLHDHGVLHRDLKAANIFVDSEGCLKIGDFGIAKMLRPGSMFAVDQIGSPYYVSPEIWKKQPYDTKSDMWAIGCFLYELIALRPPFQAKDMEALSKKIITGHYDPLPTTTSPELQRLVRRLLTLEPKARPDIDELLATPVVKEHMNLLPSVPKSSRSSHVPQPEEAFMDLRNTIHTPRRMNDMKHLLPHSTRYDDVEPGARQQKARQRAKSHPADKGGGMDGFHLPALTGAQSNRQGNSTRRHSEQERRRGHGENSERERKRGYGENSERDRRRGYGENDVTSSRRRR